jgi:coenzyme F420-reducing hydrogenase delta subunit
LGCGICAGSCDSAGIGLPWFDAIEQRHELDRKIALAPDGSLLAVVCAGSAGSALHIDANGACADLPGYTVLRAPCAGWLHPLTVERAVRRGVAGVLVVACGPGSCTYREGAKWTTDRMQGRRLPALRTDKVAADRVRVLELFAVERARLVREASAFALSRAPSKLSPMALPLRALAAAAVIAVFGAATVGATKVVHARAAGAMPMLVLSFRHAGQVADRCHDLSAAEKARLPVHMRPKKICERRRPDVRVRVALDGKPLFQRSYAPSGIWGDGMSVGIERIVVPAGDHAVLVEVGDTHDERSWNERTARRVHFEAGQNVIVVFEGDSFVWQ